MQEFFIEGANPQPALIKSVYAHLHSTADAQQEVALPIDELTKRLGRNVNGMAVSSALSTPAPVWAWIERFDIPGSRIRGSRILDPKLTPETVTLDTRALDEKRERDEQKLKKVLQWVYAQNCRQQWILRYFGELRSPACGKCDACEQARSYQGFAAHGAAVDHRQKKPSAASPGCRAGSQDISGRPDLEGIVWSKCLLGSKSKTITDAGLHDLTTWGCACGSFPAFCGGAFRSHGPTGTRGNHRRRLSAAATSPNMVHA